MQSMSRWEQHSSSSTASSTWSSSSKSLNFAGNRSECASTCARNRSKSRQPFNGWYAVGLNIAIKPNNCMQANLCSLGYGCYFRGNLKGSWWHFQGAGQPCLEAGGVPYPQCTDEIGGMSEIRQSVERGLRRGWGRWSSFYTVQGIAPLLGEMRREMERWETPLDDVSSHVICMWSWKIPVRLELILCLKYWLCVPWEIVWSKKNLKSQVLGAFFCVYIYLSFLSRSVSICLRMIPWRHSHFTSVNDRWYSPEKF